MPLSEIILITIGLLTVAMLAAGICRNIPIPYTVFLVVIGIFVGWSARIWDFLQPLLAFQLTPERVLFLFVPALVFEYSYNINARKLINNLVPIIVLAIPALLISIFLSALACTWFWECLLSWLCCLVLSFPQLIR